MLLQLRLPLMCREWLLRASKQGLWSGICSRCVSISVENKTQHRRQRQSLHRWTQWCNMDTVSKPGMTFRLTGKCLYPLRSLDSVRFGWKEGNWIPLPSCLSIDIRGRERIQMQLPLAWPDGVWGHPTRSRLCVCWHSWSDRLSSGQEVHGHPIQLPSLQLGSRSRHITNLSRLNCLLVWDMMLSYVKFNNQSKFFCSSVEDSRYSVGLRLNDNLKRLLKRIVLIVIKYFVSYNLVPQVCQVPLDDTIWGIFVIETDPCHQRMNSLITWISHWEIRLIPIFCVTLSDTASVGELWAIIGMSSCCDIRLSSSRMSFPPGPIIARTFGWPIVYWHRSAAAHVDVHITTH